VYFDMFQVVMRLLWVLENVPKIREKIAKNQVRFGTLDTYLVHKLTCKLFKMYVLFRVAQYNNNQLNRFIPLKMVKNT